MLSDMPIFYFLFCSDSERLVHENELMRNKIEQLQMMLEQRRMKRRRTTRPSTPPGGSTGIKDVGKGVFGSIQSREMAAKLEDLCSETETDIEHGTVVS